MKNFIIKSRNSLSTNTFKHIIPKSVIDIGCGLGTWLKVLEENGIKDIIGVDGNHIDKSKLQIDEKTSFYMILIPL